MVDKRDCIRVALVAVTYLTTAWLALHLHTNVSPSVTLIWPPIGVGLAATRLYGPKMLGGVYVGALIVNTIYGAGDPLSASLIALGNTGAVAYAWWVLSRYQLRPFVEDRKHLTALARAAALGCLISASVGVGALSATGHLDHSAGVAWFDWWLGDFLGMLVFEPLILIFMRPKGDRDGAVT